MSCSERFSGWWPPTTNGQPGPALACLPFGFLGFEACRMTIKGCFMLLPWPVPGALLGPTHQSLRQTSEGWLQIAACWAPQARSAAVPEWTESIRKLGFKARFGRIQEGNSNMTHCSILLPFSFRVRSKKGTQLSCRVSVSHALSNGTRRRNAKVFGTAFHVVTP